MKKEQYYILNILRGLGALFVLFYHFFVFFFDNQVMSASLLQIEPANLVDPFYLQSLNNLPINFGHLGVGFFFLISGFLIQPSLKRYPSLKAFLIHKVFRLWPTYAFCFSVGILFVIIFSLLRGTSFPYSFGHIFAYFFWIRDLFHYPFIDGAVWSLEIQVKFYIVAALIWSLWKKNFLEKICLFTALSSILVYVILNVYNNDEVDAWFYLIPLMRRNLKFFVLILLGSCLYSFYKREISLKKFLSLSSLLLVCFLSPLFSSPDLAKTLSYLLGFFSFSYLILVHSRNFKPKGWLYNFINWVSEISYPLYIGHVIPGYTIMYFMIDHGFNIYWGIVISLFYSLLMAHFVHKKNRSAFFGQGLIKLFYMIQISDIQ